jgi:GcrA cell cycle regulator
MALTLKPGRRPVELIEREAASHWTEERLAELRRLWVEETLSSSEIAQRMGISRSTVMGKINRLGLLRHQGTPTLQALSSYVGEVQEQETPPAAPLVAEQGAVQDQRIGQHPTIFELRARHCRFPVGGFREPAVFFCGKPAELPRPYCRECCGRAYTVMKPRA